MHLYPINGAAHDVAPDATAFGHRDANYACVIAGMWPDPADNEANTAWVKDFYAAIAPALAGRRLRQLRVRRRPVEGPRNYGANYARLREVKRRYDPNNLFHLNQNIRPA